ncbi:MAG: hypothetical protein JWR07_5553 [Nevskia sp.]|nr:hypothetical protein [Nevskia sp.]
MKTELAGAICIGSIALFSGCSAIPTQVKPGTPVTLQRVALSGSPQRLGFYYMVNPDCTSAGVPKVLVDQQPAHGSVTLSQVQDYSAFPSNNQRYGCNRQKNPGTVVSYTPAPGYTGPDQVSVTAIFRDGNPKVVSYDISVR